MPTSGADLKVTLRAYPCKVDRVIDGDTLVVTVDHGFKVYTSQIVRLIGVNAPERKTPEGITAKKFAMDWVILNSHKKDWPFLMRSLSMTDRYGRRLAHIVPFGEHGSKSLSNALLESGNAVPFMQDGAPAAEDANPAPAEASAGSTDGHFPVVDQAGLPG